MNGKNFAPLFPTHYYALVNLELILAIVVFIGVLILVLVMRRGKKLPSRTAHCAIKSIRETEKLDPAHAIIEAHKVFIWTLASLIPERQRKKIRAAEVVKRFVKRMPNEAQIWKTHRLRNRIAHEPNIKITSTHADLARRDLIRAIQSLSKK